VGEFLSQLTRNHALWLAPALAVLGFLSYYAFFANYPSFRDHPWLNLLILAGAVALAVAGLRHAWPTGGWRRAVSLLGVAVSAGLMGLLLFYSYWLSYQLPSADLAAVSGQRIPSIALASSEGGVFDPGAVENERLVLVFYRGFW
jgi:hypothetical protein